MKRFYYLIALCVALSTNVDAQKIYFWMDAGVKAQVGSASLLNFAAIDHKKLDYDIPFGNALGIGGKFGVHHQDLGVVFEALYSTASHEFQYIGKDIRPKMQWTSIDLYTLFRNNNDLSFFEIGPKFSYISSFKRSNETGVMEKIDTNADLAISGVLTFGVNVLGSEYGAFTGQLGLRLEYGFTDMIAKDGREPGEPLPYVTDLFQDGYKKTIPVFAGLVFELNWGIGAYAQSMCSKNAEFISL